MYPPSTPSRTPNRERYLWAVVLGAVALWGVHQANRVAFQRGALEAYSLSARERAYQQTNGFFEARGEDEDSVRPPDKLLVSQTATRSLAHNLLPELGYVTSFRYGGFTNQLNSFIKTAYFAKLTDRVLILPDFWPHHHQGTEPPFTEFFDLDRWSSLTNISMLNWQDVKLKQPPAPEPVYEKLSCWGSTSFNPLGRYNIETRFWPIPDSYKDPSLTFDSLRTMMSQDQSSYLDTARPAGGFTDPPPARPNEQLVCFDNAFYWDSLLFEKGKIDRTHTIEEFAPRSPVWKEVGQHLHFNKRVEREADRILRLLLPDAGDKPQFIGVHFRQRDFLKNGRLVHDMINEVSKELKLVRQALKAKGLSSAESLPVVVTTDSEDAIFLGRLKSKGWLRVQHEVYETRKKLGGWWPEVLDGAILSRATGFVGTRLSTMSHLQARRVESWQGGVSSTVN